jgi:hypothetical protein
MKISDTLKTAIITAAIHCIIGNLIGIYTDAEGVLGIVFLPYTFIAGMSDFAGWDLLSFVFEILAFCFMIIVFLPVGLIFSRKWPKKD